MPSLYFHFGDFIGLLHLFVRKLPAIYDVTVVNYVPVSMYIIETPVLQNIAYDMNWWILHMVYFHNFLLCVSRAYP
jgi:hypothetical protein